jgi:RNA polymerase sigma factor (sigma-70 family)
VLLRGRVAYAYVQAAPAAKSVGTCSSAFLNTRLLPARLARRRSEHEDNRFYPVLARQAMSHAGGRTMTLDFEAIDRSVWRALSDSDPLPPEDAAPRPRPLSIEALYRDQASRLVRFFARRTEPQDARDLMHDSFVRLADARANDAPERPEAYLSQVAKNVLRNRARAAYHRSVERPATIDERESSIDMTALLEARDMLRRLQSAMHKLNPKTREIFMAHRIDGLTYAELGERFGLGVKGVEWHMTKAIALLHRAAGRR